MQDAELCYFCWKRFINNYTDKNRGEILVVFVMVVIMTITLS